MNFIQQLSQLISIYPNMEISSILSTFFSQYHYVEDTNRIFLFNNQICIAKNRQGNALNAHEWYCSTITQDYAIHFFPFNKPYFNMTHGIILKPFFLSFDKDLTSYNLMLYQSYSLSLSPLGFSLTPKQNPIGMFNGKLVLTDYSNFIPYFIPYSFPLICRCGYPMSGGLEPCCSNCGSTISFNSEILNSYHFEHLKKYTGGF